MIKSADLAATRTPYSVNKINVLPPPTGICPTCAKGAKVATGFCHPETVIGEWRRAYTMVLMRDAHTSQHIVAEYAHWASGAHIATARCRIVKDFLASEAEWLWMQDTDATYGELILERLLACADPVKAPIVGGLAFSVRAVADDDGVPVINEVGASPLKLEPTLFRMRGDGQLLRLLDYEKDAMVPVDATGCHCLLVHRSVFEDSRWDHSHPMPWFQSGTLRHNGEVSEDMFFCLRAREMGYPIFVNTSARTGHVKPFIADEDRYLAQREATVPKREVRPLVTLIPSRSADRLDALLPVLLAQGGFDRLVVAWNGDPSVTGEAFLDGRLEWRQVSFDGGLHALWNIAIDEFPDHDVCILNDDITVGDEFCARLQAGLYRNRLIAAVCPNYDGRPGAGFEAVGDICAGRYDGTGGFAGFAFAISRDWLTAGGYRFPDEMRLFYGDNDLVLAVLRSGFTLGIDYAVECRHEEYGASSLDSPEMQEIYAADTQAFVARWPGLALQPVA